MSDCIEAYPDYKQFLDAWDAGTFSKTDALREYLEAKRRWEIHRFTCPQVRGIYKSGPGPEELSLTEDTNTPNERRKINHKAKLPQPLYDQPLEEEAPAVRPFSDEEYGRLSRAIRSVLTEHINGSDRYVPFSDFPREKSALIMQKIFEKVPILRKNCIDPRSLGPLITDILSGLYGEDGCKVPPQPPRPPKGSLEGAVPVPERLGNGYQEGQYHHVATNVATYTNPQTFQALPCAGDEQPGAYQAPNAWAPSFHVPCGPLSHEENVYMSPLDKYFSWDPSS